MSEKRLERYIENIKELKKECLTIRTESSFYDEDGAYIWGFSSSLVKEGIDEDKVVVTLSGGLIIPEEFEFGDEDYDIIKEYSSAWELCDSISADVVSVYETIANIDGGIKDEIIRELGLSNEDSYESPIMFIQNITATEEKYLRLFLEMFATVKEGLPDARYCKIAAVLFKFKEEADNIKVFLELGWKLKNIDENSVIAYYRI